MKRILFAAIPAVVVVAVFFLFAMYSPPAHADPDASWSPKAAAVSLHPNESTTTIVTLIAKEDIEKATVRVTTNLLPYVTVFPLNVTKLKKNTPLAFRIVTKLPIDTSAGLIQGTLQLRKVEKLGRIGEAIAKPLPINIGVICPCLPPDPGEAGKATLEGIDSDNDGVRDDIQRWIAVNNPSSERMRQSQYQLSRAFGSVVVVTDLQSASIADRALAKGMDCLEATIGIDNPDLWKTPIKALEAQYFNTQLRWAAYRNFGNLSVGLGHPATELSDKLAQCSFDATTLPN